MYKRIFLIVIDSVGIGEMPDAKDYGDVGANTIRNISLATNGITLPNMEALGYGNLTEIKGVNPVSNPKGYYTKMAEISVGKDTMTGHWELMGLRIDTPFQTFTDTGFPESLIKELEEKTGRKIVGNKASSGTVILDEYGEHHLKTGDLIVYTSADSVLQIAAHEEVVSVEELYKACEIARELTLADAYKVGRVIARPFLGDRVGEFKRTSNRHDYALKPFGKTTLNYLEEAGYDVVSFGKIKDIYDGEGITESYKQDANKDGMENFTNFTEKDFKGLAFLNLVDFDALYGHRRDPQGYKEALEEFDAQLEVLIGKLKEDDLLMITADHGNDPTHEGTDHTREYVPLLVYNKKLKGGPLTQRDTFADIGATISENFNVKQTRLGTSFLKELK
ncbi:phosphopentomutase [Liberiplasma polymorphum]|uniref:phosphopentomutase n=1 Tax=Liberiplasma polymorphum TaxID=3374570 RepID=UPI00377654F0